MRPPGCGGLLDLSQQRESPRLAKHVLEAPAKIPSFDCELARMVGLPLTEVRAGEARYRPRATELIVRRLGDVQRLREPLDGFCVVSAAPRVLAKATERGNATSAKSRRLIELGRPREALLSAVIPPQHRLEVALGAERRRFTLPVCVPGEPERSIEGVLSVVKAAKDAFNGPDSDQRVGLPIAVGWIAV